jgi:serine/threonine-protein kinase
MDASGEEASTMDVATPAPRRRGSSSAGRTPSVTMAIDSAEGRFLPGVLIADRYRIIALLGKGGMGEVYRADDLTLGQPVALKFLPQEYNQNEGLLERFRNEVRISRKVSHPNVCRVYDVGEVDGSVFFTMEYIDGEDLASLLRRIGRLPHDKALEIARQLCAGVAAAHAKGVLHRDLKPANVMLDGRGQVVVMDFGLAGLAEQIQGADIRSGTPAYMAPEQLEGKEVSVRSDLFALGLVLYEIFTGKRAFQSTGFADRRGETVSRPSSLVRDLDPLVEKIILRCLETDPARRPESALSVAAALPGGDPLAAALAAGETPSPEMVAAAGESIGISAQVALLCVIAALVGLVVTFFLGIKLNALPRMGLDQSPEVLTHKAKDLITQLGYDSKAYDTVSNFSYDNDFMDHVKKTQGSHANWDKILPGRPAVLRFWYRQSPKFLSASDFRDQLLTPGIVTEDDPATTISGMVNVELDPEGRLTYLQAIPPQLEAKPGPTQTLDWNVLFKAAGLDPTQLQPADPQWTSLADSDIRVAWTGNWPGTDLPLRVEAAALRGRPVFFSLIGPWTKAERMQADKTTKASEVSQIVQTILFLAILTTAILIARRNFRRGRGDTTGSYRLASVVFALLFLVWLGRSHFMALSELSQLLGSLIILISTALFVSGVTFILYMAVEPYVRSHWPKMIISWNRLLLGQFRDPLVGRDMLFGVLLGLLWCLIIQLRQIPLEKLGAPPFTSSLGPLMGLRQDLGEIFALLPNSIQTTLIFFFLALLLRMLLRRDWFAGIAFTAIWAGLNILQDTSYLKIAIPSEIVIYGVAAIVVFRVGLVALATGIFTANLLINVPVSIDSSAWYATTSLIAPLMITALALWAFYLALAGRPLFKAGLLD